MVRRRKRLQYYHSGCYEDLTNYKRRKIEKEILQMDSGHKRDTDIRCGLSVKVSSKSQKSTFDEIGTLLHQIPVLSPAPKKAELPCKSSEKTYLAVSSIFGCNMQKTLKY